MQIKMRTVSTT